MANLKRFGADSDDGLEGAMQAAAPSRGLKLEKRPTEPAKTESPPAPPAKGAQKDEAPTAAPAATNPAPEGEDASAQTDANGDPVDVEVIPKAVQGPKILRTHEAAVKRWKAPEGLDTRVEQRLRSAAIRIRSGRRIEAAMVIIIGNDMNAAREHLKHGEFTAWLKEACGVQSRASAYRYMQAAERISDPTRVGHLRPSTVYKLTQRQLPDEVLQRALESGSEEGALAVLREFRNAQPGGTSAETDAQDRKTARAIADQRQGADESTVLDGGDVLDDFLGITNQVKRLRERMGDRLASSPGVQDLLQQLEDTANKLMHQLEEDVVPPGQPKTQDQREQRLVT